MNNISDNAIKFVKENKSDIINRFADKNKYKPFKKPVSFFMAGSPGAGKTELSKIIIEALEKNISASLKAEKFSVVRIDSDEIRNLLPGYNGSNSSLFQGACALAVNKLYTHVLKNDMNALLDGTFASYKYAKENIERALKRKREVYIYYVFQNPKHAWEFTLAREKKEGRNIPLEAFVESFFKAKENINKIKSDFGNNIRVSLIIRDYSTNINKYKENIDNIDNYIKFSYDKESLYKELQDLKQQLKIPIIKLRYNLNNIKNMLKFLKIFNGKESSSYSKLSSKEKKKIIKYAINKTNKEQSDTVKRYGVAKEHKPATS